MTSRPLFSISTMTILIVAVLVGLVTLSALTTYELRDIRAQMQEENRAVLQRIDTHLSTIQTKESQVLASIVQYVTPTGRYREGIDAALCAQLRDVRAIAAHDHVALPPLLAPPRAKYFVNIGGCWVAVLK